MNKGLRRDFTGAKENQARKESMNKGLREERFDFEPEDGSKNLRESCFRLGNYRYVGRESRCQSRPLREGRPDRLTSANYLFYILPASEILYFRYSAATREGCFMLRRPDLLRPSRIPGTDAISTKAESHFILRTIPDRKAFSHN